jgi:glutamate N-acetyltransferase/amino-acid N-acetyltransferase
MTSIAIPKGFSFATAAAAFRKEGRQDLGLVLSDRPAVAAGLFTTNRFQAAPVLVCKELLEKSGTARGVVVNSGQANACTGDVGVVNCRLALEMTAEALGNGLAEEDLLPMSTGVIGPHLRLDRWKAALDPLAHSLGKAGPVDVAKAMLTTDKFPKLAWGRVADESGATRARVLGVAKGAGMICPNMATMLGLVLTDAQVEPKEWKALLRRAVDQSFNRVTVDGDTSTNDTVLGLANGASGSVFSGAGLEALERAVTEVCQALSYMLVEDAEGGTKVIRITVAGAEDDAQAELAARTVGHSPLVKTAFYGKDANWGRIVAALGRSGAHFDPDRVLVRLGGIAIFRNGRPEEGDMDSLLAPHLHRRDVSLEISLGDGPGRYVLLASDLTHEYVSINADYRT